MQTTQDYAIEAWHSQFSSFNEGLKILMLLNICVQVQEQGGQHRFELPCLKVVV